MGFGTLFFGYFVMFAFSLSKVYFFADVVGALITIYAFTKLAKYNRWYNSAMISCLAFLVLCTVNAVSLMWKLYPSDGAVDRLVDVGKAAAACVTHVFLFLGAKGIALGAGAEKLAKAASSGLVRTGVYYAVSLAWIPLSLLFSDELTAKVGAVVYLYWIVCLVMNLWFLYRCFGILCPADENEDEVKPSRFAIINKMDAKMEAFEKKSNDYRRESMQMAMDEADRRAAAKKQNAPRHVHNHKKKK